MSYNLPNSQLQTKPQKRLPLWLHWWYQLPLSEQDRIFALTPIMALAVFIGFVLLSYTYLNKQQYERERINTQHSATAVAQQIRLTLIDNEAQIKTMATETVAAAKPSEIFNTQAKILLNDRPEITALYWHDLTTDKILVYPAAQHTHNLDLVVREDNQIDVTQIQSHLDGLNFTYSVPFFIDEGPAKINASMSPTPAYVLTATYDLDRLLRKSVPADVSLYTNIWLQGKEGETLAATNPLAVALPDKESEITPSSAVTPNRFAGEISIYAQSTQVQRTLSGNFLFWFTVGLSLFTGTLIVMNWRHTQLLVNAQHAAQRESNFRKAIEDSLTIGLQGIDLQQRISYVNPAFCKMVGFDAHELIGQKAPFPYWPDNLSDTYAQTMSLFAKDLPTNGAEAQMRRKNGEYFYAMLHVAPLVNEVGVQNGWVASINDISESKRSREELALAGQRFTTVLEGMDAAISVTAVGSKTFLFTNNAYRTLFGDNEEVHNTLVRELNRLHPNITDTDITPFSPVTNPDDFDQLKEKMLLKYYLEDQDRWIEVRSQFLPWVDGRLAQMLVTTDITDRHKAEELAAIQAEKTEAAGRLITMGEMASSVAHELNQPLTAIHNYCSGLIRRVENNTLSQDELLQALQKTAKQANRAGKITLRIREFVKKNTPNRIPTKVSDVIDNIYELIEIDAHRRNIKIDIQIENDLPLIDIDPILIEQVLLNLTRNATESVNDAKRPLNERHLKIKVKRIADNKASEKLEFSVLDSGTGMPQEVIDHMFDAFFTTKPNGAGIGLNLCRSIVESHGGQLYFQNIHNQGILAGCRFAFTLPLKPEPKQ